MNIKSLLSILLPAVALCAACSGISHSEKRLPAIAPEKVCMDPHRLEMVDSVIESAIADSIMPGAVLAVVKDSRMVYLKAYGNKSVYPEVEPMTVQTVFDLASLSKCIGTTLSFMQLIEDGKVNLNDNVKRYIPDFAPWIDPDCGEAVDITVRDLLTHTSGIDAYPNVARCRERFGDNCPDKYLEYIAKEAGRNFRPGTDFLYSCQNFVALQGILESVTGMKLCDYAAKNVFAKLGLGHTSYLPIDREIPDEMKALVAPTEVEDGCAVTGMVHDPLARFLNWGNSGNAGVFSCAEDLAVVAAAIINGGEYGGERLFSPATARLMVTVPEQNAPHVGRALGWDVSSSHSGIRGNLMALDHCIGHTGYTGPSMVIDLDKRTAVILLAHRVHPKDTGSLARTRAMVANIVASSILN